MTTPSRVHRASAQRRRAALLDAAAELAAEVGAGAVTHRGVAARAGVPLSTTSYFFSSIDELVTEALRQSSQARVAGYDAAERVWVESEGEPIEAAIEGLIDQMLAASPTDQGILVEYYLAAGRQEELRLDVSAVANRFAARSERRLSRMGAPGAADISWALLALSDGTMLHRLAGIDTDHRARLLAGIRALLAASMLTDQEYTDLFERFDRSAVLGAEPSVDGSPRP